MKKTKSKKPNRRSDIEKLLKPGGAKRRYASLRQTAAEESDRRWFAYSLLSSINSAIRERAEDQNRSTDRREISSASAVSAVVKPAK